MPTVICEDGRQCRLGKDNKVVMTGATKESLKAQPEFNYPNRLIRAAMRPDHQIVDQALAARCQVRIWSHATRWRGA